MQIEQLLHKIETLEKRCVSQQKHLKLYSSFILKQLNDRKVSQKTKLDLMELASNILELMIDN